MEIGDTFLMGSPGEKKHLHICIGRISDSKVILVYVSTKGIQRSDCVLTAGEHPWIKQDCGVVFGHPNISYDLTVDQAIERRIAVPKAPLATGTVQKIVSAALASDRFPEGLKAHLRGV